jgi:sulfur-oxidizing protein SoxX
MKKTAWIVCAAALATVAGCAALSSDSNAGLNQQVQHMLLTGFHERGIAKMERITSVDDGVKLCNAADIAGKPLDEAAAKRIQDVNFKAIKWPSDGKFLGDWKKGEALAQSGRGQTWSDDAQTPGGGNCYNCHQITQQEISYGTLGPSLYNYGKLHGVTDPASPEAKPVLEFVWGRIWNAKAYSACSNMPRFGHMGNLSEQQIRDLMALLLDPQSPVNQ